MSVVIFLNGKFVSLSKAKVSVFDHGFLYGDGVFDRLRTYGGKVWNLKAHVKRFFYSARLIKIHIPWNQQKVTEWIEKAVGRAKFPEANIRITLTRGLGKKNLKYDFLTPRTPTVCIMVTRLTSWPAAFYKKGIKVITVQQEREFPEVKTISLLPQVIANHAMAKVKANEALFVHYDGRVTEGTASTFYFVSRGKILIPDTRLLPGTTMEIVKKLAKKAGIPVLNTVVPAAWFGHGDSLPRPFPVHESFITSVTRGIMPVASINGKKFLSPGPVTKKLMELFQEYVAQFSPRPKTAA